MSAADRSFGAQPHLFAGLAVSDFERAVAWVERLLGAPATFEAHATDWVWTLAENRSVYVVLRPERAGSGMVTVFVDDIEAFVGAAARRGVQLDEEELYQNGVRKVTYRDPDGNEIAFAGTSAEA